jgi:hypothetical protein
MDANAIGRGRQSSANFSRSASALKSLTIGI